MTLETADPRASEGMLSDQSTKPSARVSSLELFFDLVFVFTVTRITHLVTDARGSFDFLRAFLVLAVIWWMYDGYAWLANNVTLVRTTVRLLMLAGMAGFLVMALATPRVTGRDGLAFGVAYLVVVLVHAALFTQAPSTSARAMYRVAPFNVACALFVIAAGLAPPRWNVILWIGALLSLLTPTVLRAERGFQLRPDHFAERHGAIILIALGESVAGLGAGPGDIRVGLPLVRVAVLGLALAAALWWSYFDRDDHLGELALTRAEGPARARLAVQAYWLAHLLMIAGIVVVAAGLETVIAGVTHPAESATAWRIAIGIAIYLYGEALFRRLLDLGPIGGRVVAALVAMATVPIALAAGYDAQLLVLVVLLTAMLIVERWTQP